MFLSGFRDIHPAADGILFFAGEYCAVMSTVCLFLVFKGLLTFLDDCQGYFQYCGWPPVDLRLSPFVCSPAPLLRFKRPGMNH